MSTNLHLRLLCFLLAVTGLGLFIYKSYVMQWPLTPSSTTPVWTVETRIQFLADAGRPVKIKMYLPPEQPNFSQLDEHFISRSYGVTTNTVDKNQLSTWTIRRSTGNQSLYYRTILYPEQRRALDTKAPIPPTGLTLTGPDKVAAESLIMKVRESSADSPTFATEVVKHLRAHTDDNALTLLDRNYSPQNIALVAKQVLDGAHIPSQIVHGFNLNSQSMFQRDVSMNTLLAVWGGKKKNWVYINPANGHVGLPDDYLIWWYGDSAMIDLDGGKNLKTTISVSSSLQSMLEITRQEAQRETSNLWKFSLYSLPVDAQNVYKVMIMIPLGAFIILLLRNLVGLQTFGTFMPVLVALAFRETKLLSGIILFSSIIAAGLLVRFYLEHLKLLLVPRIATVLSSVVLIMVTMSVLSYQLGLDYGMSLALFPMVILTMTIERMSLVWEERNPWEAILQVAGSLFAAAIAYLVMNNPYAQHLTFTFPELILVLMSLMVLLGRYRGYRLSELIRFNRLLAIQKK